jgi:hypothetical protein
MTDGWDTLDQAPPPETPELAHEFTRAFATSSGAAVLAALSKLTINRPMPDNCTDAELRRHQGACKVVWHILNQIERGRQ